MISTIEMCVRNFVDHGFSRDKAVGATAIAIFILGIPSAVIAIKVDSASGVMYPEFLEVQDHIWGYGLMFSGLFIAFTIWKYGWKTWKEKSLRVKQKRVLEDIWNMECQHLEMTSLIQETITPWVGSWWDKIMYFGFPIMFSVLILSYFSDLIFSFDPWYLHLTQ